MVHPFYCLLCCGTYMNVDFFFVLSSVLRLSGNSVLILVDFKDVVFCVVANQGGFCVFSIVATACLWKKGRVKSRDRMYIASYFQTKK